MCTQHTTFSERVKRYWPSFKHRLLAFACGAFVTFIASCFPFASLLLWPLLFWFWWAFVVSAFLPIRYQAQELEVNQTPLFAPGENAGGEPSGSGGQRGVSA